MTRTILASALAALALVAAGAASAETPSARIHHGDLDLNTASGAQAFAGRVETTARDFCRTSFARPSDRSTCERTVRVEVMQQLPKYAQVRYALNRL